MFVASSPHVRTVPAAPLIVNSSPQGMPVLRLHDNPLFCLEKTILRKLIAIGMLATDGSLTDNARSILVKTPQSLHREQCERFLAFTEQHTTLMKSKEISQLEWHKHTQAILEGLEFTTGETYLCGEGAEYVLGLTDHFVNLVMTYLHATGLPENILDLDLNALTERNSRENAPKTIEWFDHLENFDASALNQVKDSHETLMKDEGYSSEIHVGEGFFEITFGDQTKITKRRIGKPDSLVTLRSFHIPVKFFLYCLSVKENIQPVIEPTCFGIDFNQGVIDKTLKILRLIRNPVDENDGAKIALFHSQNAFFPYGSSYAVKTNTEALQTVIDQSYCNPAALAFAASHKASNALALWQGLKSENQNPFFAEIQRLVTEENIPLPTIRSLLCFAAWVRVCHPSNEWVDKTGVTVTLMPSRKKFYFVLHSEGGIIKVSITPRKYTSLLSKMPEEHFEKLQKLWDLLIPTRIGEVLPKFNLRTAMGTYTLIFENFKNSANFLISHPSPFLNQIGYTCAIAFQGIYRGRSGLDPVFKNLMGLLPEDPKSCYEELVFLTSIVTPRIPFVANSHSKNDQLISFIHHLLSHQARFYGNALLENFLNNLPLQEQSSVLFSLLSMQFEQNPLEAIALYKMHQAVLNETSKLAFLAVMAENKQAGLLPELLGIANALLPCEITAEQQKLLMQLIHDAAETGLFESGEQLLKNAAQILSEENWQESVRFFCESMLKNKERGPVDALKTWELLSKIKAVSCPQDIFTALKILQGQPISLSEYALNNLQPHQRIEAIQRELCSDIDAEKLKQFTTDSLLNLIKNNEENQVLRLFNEHHFTEENCHLAIVQKNLLEYFNDPLPTGSEISRFQFLLQLAKTRTLAPSYKNILLLLSQKLPLIPAIPTQELSGKDLLCLQLISEMINEACASSDGPFTAKTIQLLETIWNEKPSFFEKLSEIIVSSEAELFHILMKNDFLDEASIFYRFIEIHNIPKSKKCISGALLYSFFKKRIAASKTESLYRSLKFSIRSKRLDLNESIKLLLKFIPLLANDPACLRECKEMLFSRLNSLKQDHLAKYYIPCMQAFGTARKEALNYLLKLNKCSKAKVFQTAKDHLFPYMPKSELLDTLKEHYAHFQSPGKLDTESPKTATALINEPSQSNVLTRRSSRARKSKRKASRAADQLKQSEASDSKKNNAASSQSSIQILPNAIIEESTQLFLEVLEYGLLECVAGQQDLNAILTLMKNVHFWPNSVLQAILAKYPAEEFFKILWTIKKENAFNASTSKQQEYFKEIFEAMLQKPSPYINELASSYTDWETLFDPQVKDSLKAKYLEAIITMLNSKSDNVPHMTVIAKIRLSLDCSLPISSENDLILHMLASSDEDLLECTFYLAILRLYGKNLPLEDKELLYPTVAKMMALNYKPNLERLLRFYRIIYEVYPGHFEEQTKSYIRAKFLELCPDNSIEEKSSYEDEISRIFFNLAENPTESSKENPVPISLQLCEHYFVSFANDVSFETLRLMHLQLIRARLKHYNKSKDESEIIQSLAHFTKFLQLHFEDNDPPILEEKEDHLFGRESLSCTIKDALANLVPFVDRLKNTALFVEQYEHLFSRLTAWNRAISDEKATQSAMQGYYLQLISMLNQIPPSSFVLTFIENCFRKQLILSDEQNQAKITDCIKGYVYLLFRLTPTIGNVSSYQKVKQLLEDLQETKLLSNELLQLMIVLNHIICHTIQSPLEINETLTSSISEILIKNTEKAELSALNEAYFLLRRVRPLFSKLPYFQKHCSETFFTVLPSLHFDYAIVFLADAASEFGEHSNDYKFYVNAIYAVISKALATANPNSFIAVRVFIQALHADLELDTISLLNCYNLFFNSLKLLEFSNAFIFVKSFCEQFVRENSKLDKSKGVVEDIKLANVLFLNFFKLALVEHNFPHYHAAFSNLAVTFLFDLQRIGFFDGKYDVFSHAFKRLVAKNAFHLTSQTASRSSTAVEDPLSALYTNFEENPQLLTVECLTALFDVLNHHIEALLPLGYGFDILRKITPSLLKLYSSEVFEHKKSLYYTLVQLLKPCHLSAVKLSEAGHAYESFSNFIEITVPSHFPAFKKGSSSTRSQEQSLLLSVFRNFEGASVPDECLTTLFSFLNDYISSLPHPQRFDLLKELTQRLQHLYSLGFFNTTPVLYYKLIQALIPSNLELMKTQLDVGEVEETKDFITGLLINEKVPEDKILEQALAVKIKMVADYTNALSKLSSSKTVVFRGELIHKMARLLKQLLEKKYFDKTFPVYLSLIQHLIPCNVSLIQSQLEKRDKGTDFLIDLFFCELANQPLFMSVPLLQARTELVAFYAKSYIELGNPQTVEHGIEQFRQATNAIFQLLLNGFFDTRPLLYYKLIQAFIPCQLELTAKKLDLPGDLEDFVFSLMMHRELESKPAFFSSELIIKKLTAIVSYYNKHTAIEHAQTEIQQLLVKHREEILRSVTTLLKRLLIGNSFNKKKFPYYLNCIQLLSDTNVDLIHSQLKTGLPPTDLISDLIFCSHASHKKFMTKELVNKKSDIANHFCNSLIALKMEPANELSCQILRKIAEMYALHK